MASSLRLTHRTVPSEPILVGWLPSLGLDEIHAHHLELVYGEEDGVYFMFYAKWNGY